MRKTIEDTWSELKARGFVQDISNDEGIKALKPGDGCYVGFDPTAPYLQIGNLIPLMASIHLGLGGLNPILLFGGATGAIGDPSGRNKERALLLSKEEIDRNVKNQQVKALEIMERSGVKPSFTDNLNWSSNITIIDFLRDVGKHLTVNFMLQKEVIKTRLSGDGISYTEFSYMLLQANDFLHLYQNMNCKLQFGGSDQWGNMTAGLELIRKRISSEAFAFSIPLLTDSEGRKFGKSESGALWLDTEGTSAYRLHQYMLNVADVDVNKLLKVLTFIPLNKIEEITVEHSKNPEKRMGQNMIADELLNLIHGEDAARLARKSAEILFGGSLEGLSDKEILEVFAEVPSSTLKRSELEKTSATDLFATSKLADSKSAARRLISQGGAYVNNQRVEDESATLTNIASQDSSVLVLRSGKKSYHLIHLTP